MKNLRFQLFIILLICNAFVLKAQTNVYHPFPDSANYFWGVKYYLYDDACMCINNSSYRDVMGDTISHNGFTYRKIETNSYNFGLSPYTLQRLIRQEVVQKKVYALNYYTYTDTSGNYITMYDSTEYLLYDFGIDINDSLLLKVTDPTLTTPQIDRYFICTAIDSVLTSDGYRKRFKMEFTEFPYWSQFTLLNYDYWIEGIGSVFNVFYDVPGCLAGECTVGLGCFGKYTNSIYDADSIYGMYCNELIFVGFDTAVLSQNEIVFADNKLRLKNADIIKELILMDPIGRVILQSSNNASEIELPKLASGIYIVQIKTQDKLFTKKVYTN